MALLLFVGFAGIGVTRLEDRAIIGAPGAPANAMAAFAGAPAAEGDDGEDYLGDPEEFTSLGRASRAPRYRIRQALRERDIPRIAARQIVDTPAPGVGQEQGVTPDTGTGSVLPQLPTIPASQPVALASLAPPTPGTGTPVFAADLAPSNGGGGGGGGGGGNPTDPVTPIPEPSTWLSMMLGIFGTGMVLRRRPRRAAVAIA